MKPIVASGTDAEVKVDFRWSQQSQRAHNRHAIKCLALRWRCQATLASSECAITRRRSFTFNCSAFVCDPEDVIPGSNNFLQRRGPNFGVKDNPVMPAKQQKSLVITLGRGGENNAGHGVTVAGIARKWEGERR
jgi:hypothetical protein